MSVFLYSEDFYNLLCKDKVMNKLQLKEDERLDNLLADETMKIIQSQSAFAFSLDAVLLADFAKIPLKKREDSRFM